MHILNSAKTAASATQSLGEHLDNLLGVSSADYGAASGQPVIRGISGARIKVLNNNLVVRDVSGLGPDHINEVDLNDIEQIEIVRGPSSLLYASGGIGGIVNIVDNTIPRKNLTQPIVKFGSEIQTVNDGRGFNFSFQNYFKGINLTLFHKQTDLDDFEIPSGAIISGEESLPEERQAEEHDENPNALANSAWESANSRLGLSKAGGWGFAGISYRRNKSDYGIPFHNPQVEEHGVEESCP